MSVPQHHTVMHGARPRLILMEIMCLAHGVIVAQDASQNLKVQAIKSRKT